VEREATTTLNKYLVVVPGTRYSSKSAVSKSYQVPGRYQVPLYLVAGTSGTILILGVLLAIYYSSTR